MCMLTPTFIGLVFFSTKSLMFWIARDMRDMSVSFSFCLNYKIISLWVILSQYAKRNSEPKPHIGEPELALLVILPQKHCSVLWPNQCLWWMLSGWQLSSSQSLFSACRCRQSSWRKKTFHFRSRWRVFGMLLCIRFAYSAKTIEFESYFVFKALIFKITFLSKKNSLNKPGYSRDR